jgi:hypothetical protein
VSKRKYTPPHQYTAAETRFLEKKVAGRSHAELAEVKHFRHYTPEEIRFVKKNIRGCSYVEMTKLFNERFHLRITLKQMETLVYKHGLRNGIGSFRAGHVPANKGKTHPVWQGNYKPVGSERTDDGYIVIKVSDRKNRGNKNWRRKHNVIWEQAHGKIPRGHVVIFADGNKLNLALDNLLLISMKEHMAMNRWNLRSDHGGLTRAGKMIADIKIAISDRKRGKKRARKK